MIFEKAKGKLNAPVAYTKVIQPGCSPHIADCYPRTELQIYTSNSADVKAMFEGKVVAVYSDTGRYLVITKYGDFFIVYFDLSNCVLKKGDYINTGQFIGCSTKDDDDEFCLYIQMAKNNKNLNPYSWIKW